MKNINDVLFSFQSDYAHKNVLDFYLINDEKEYLNK
jgi:hypothetical protein